MAIAVGYPCDDYDSAIIGAYTVVNEIAAANATGTIDYVCIYTQNNFTSCEFASFYDAGGGLSTRDTTAGDPGSSTTGLNEFNAPGDFTAFDINSGDYLGMYYSGTIERKGGTTGDGCWYEAGDLIPCTEHSFTTYRSDRSISLYATGTEAGNGRTTYNPRGEAHGEQHGMMFGMTYYGLGIGRG